MKTTLFLENPLVAWFKRPSMGQDRINTSQEVLNTTLVMLELQQCNAVPTLSFLLRTYDAPQAKREAAARKLWKQIMRLNPDTKIRQSLLRVICGPFYGPQLAEWLSLGTTGEGRMDDYLLLAREAERRWFHPEELGR